MSPFMAWKEIYKEMAFYTYRSAMAAANLFLTDLLYSYE